MLGRTTQDQAWLRSIGLAVAYNRYIVLLLYNVIFQRPFGDDSEEIAAVEYLPTIQQTSRSAFRMHTASFQRRQPSALTTRDVTANYKNASLDQRLAVRDSVSSVWWIWSRRPSSQSPNPKQFDLRTYNYIGRQRVEMLRCLYRRLVVGRLLLLGYIRSSSSQWMFALECLTLFSVHRRQTVSC